MPLDNCLQSSSHSLSAILLCLYSSSICNEFCIGLGNVIGSTFGVSETKQPEVTIRFQRCAVSDFWQLSGCGHDFFDISAPNSALSKNLATLNLYLYLINETGKRNRILERCKFWFRFPLVNDRTMLSANLQRFDKICNCRIGYSSSIDVLCLIITSISCRRLTRATGCFTCIVL